MRNWAVGPRPVDPDRCTELTCSACLIATRSTYHNDSRRQTRSRDSNRTTGWSRPALDRRGMLVADQDPNAWLMLCAGATRQFGGNLGYDDVPSQSYKWDSTVPNHARVKEGDIIFLWDKKQSLGISTIDTILTAEQLKTVRRCPACRSTNIKERILLSPTYRCQQQNCKLEFDTPIVYLKKVIAYETSHRRNWVPLLGALLGQELRSLCKSRNSQHSIRSIDIGKLRKSLHQIESDVFDSIL